MTKCNGKADCERHPHIRHKHPATPVSVTFNDGQTAAVDYSDNWEMAEAEWERVSQSPEGRAWLDSLIVEGP